jgi:hypothetical protein
MKKILLIPVLILFALILHSCGNRDEGNSGLIGEDAFPIVGDEGSGKKVFVHNLSDGKTEVFDALKNLTPFLITGTGERGNYFFVTGNEYNKTEGYIDSIVVYIHNYQGTRVVLGSPKVSKIFSNILDGNTMNLVLYHLELVNQRIYRDNYIIDSTGRIVSKGKEKFDLLQGQIPDVPAIKVNNTSPDGLKTITIEQGEQNKILLMDNKTTQVKQILSTTQKIDRVYWTPDKESIILLTSNLDVQKTDNDTSSTLLVYSLKKMDYTAKFSGRGYRNFSVKKDKLVFDDLENEKRYVRIYDLKSMRELRQIRMKNGCSIRFLPFY